MRSEMPGIRKPELHALETTGLNPEKDAIIEIAALKVMDGAERDKYQALVRTDIRVSDEIKSLTGLTDEIIAQGMPLERAIDGFLEFVSSAPVVMHNAEFDMAFIDAALDKLGIDELDNDCIDTLALAKKRIPQEQDLVLMI